MNCGLKAYRAEVVDGLRIYGELHRFIPVLAHYRGYRVAELPVNHRPARARPLALRHRALRARLPRPAHGHVHGPLPHRPLHLFGGLGLRARAGRLRRSSST
jgi:hypothetical protein